MRPRKATNILLARQTDSFTMREISDTCGAHVFITHTMDTHKYAVKKMVGKILVHSTEPLQSFKNRWITMDCLLEIIFIYY